jgi:hypothetical protein
MFKSTFINSIYLSTEGPSCMVFEHLRDLFDPKDSTNDFSRSFPMCSSVVIGHIPMNITKALGATRLLVLAKPSTSIQPIAVGEVFIDW